MELVLVTLQIQLFSTLLIIIGGTKTNAAAAVVSQLAKQLRGVHGLEDGRSNSFEMLLRFGLDGRLHVGAEALPRVALGDGDSSSGQRGRVEDELLLPIGEQSSTQRQAATLAVPDGKVQSAGQLHLELAAAIAIGHIWMGG